jgi:tektin-2
MIDSIKRILHQRCQDACAQIHRLQESRSQLLNDLNDKNQAFSIDDENLALTKDSSAISFKPNPLRVPKGSITPQQWVQFSQQNKEKSDSEMHSSKKLRENIQLTMAQSASDLEAQKNATDFAMRRRIHETEQAREELGWQKKQVRDHSFSNLKLIFMK